MARFRIDVHDGDPARVALILPGSGYTAEHPALAFPRDALRDDGWSLRTFVWEERPTLEDATQAYPAAVRELVAGQPEARHLVLAKSLGALALPTCQELGISGVWLTPPLTDVGPFSVREPLLAMDGAAVPNLLVGGADDPLWDPDVAALSGADVVEVAGAAHSLTVRGSWRASLAALGDIVGAVERCAERAGSARSR